MSSPFLSQDDYTTCSFGRKYYTGACVASGLSLFPLFFIGRRTLRTGNENVKLAIKKLSSVKVQQKIDILDKYAPSSSTSSPSSQQTKLTKDEFYKQQAKF